MTISERANEWICSDDTGTSSKTIWAVMQRTKARDRDVPYDAGDFGRCYRLLELIPEWRARLDDVARAQPAWVGIVREWAKLEALYRDVLASNWSRIACLAFSDALDPLIDEGRIADGWKRTSPTTWSKGEAFSVEIARGVRFGRKA